MTPAIPMRLLLALTSCAPRSLKDCNLERIAAAHRAELSLMLSNYPATTKQLMRAITSLEQEAGGY